MKTLSPKENIKYHTFPCSLSRCLQRVSCAYFVRSKAVHVIIFLNTIHVTVFLI